MFSTQVGRQRSVDVHVLGKHPVKFRDHRFGGRTDTVAQQPHRLLFASLGIDVHVNRAVNALIDDHNGEFSVDAPCQNAPQQGVLGCVVLRIVDGEVTESRAVDDNALNAGGDDRFDVLSMEPGTCNELRNALPCLVGGRSLGQGAR